MDAKGLGFFTFFTQKLISFLFSDIQSGVDLCPPWTCFHPYKLALKTNDVNGHVITQYLNDQIRNNREQTIFFSNKFENWVHIQVQTKKKCLNV